MIIFFLAVFGLIFGSFVNALVYRLHAQAGLAKSSTKAVRAQRDKLSIVHGRSMCSHCHHELAAKDLVPVLSWLWLRGRCRYCRTKIEDSPLVEVKTSALFVLSYLWWPLPLQGSGLVQFIVWLLFIVAAVALTVYDLRWFLLPNKIVYPLIGLVVGQTLVVALMKHDASQLVGPALGALLFWGIFYLLFQVSKGQWIGGGDVKLALALGLLAGSGLNACLVLFFASFLGTLWNLPALIKRERSLTAQIPFGPFLLAATFIVVLFGQKLTDLLA